MDYSAKDIETILAVLSWSPRSFRELARKKGCSVTDHELSQSFHAWGIDPDASPPSYSQNRSNQRRSYYRK